MKHIESLKLKELKELISELTNLAVNPSAILLRLTGRRNFPRSAFRRFILILQALFLYKDDSIIDNAPKFFQIR